jgi:hypothetical protein
VTQTPELILREQAKGALDVKNTIAKWNQAVTYPALLVLMMTTASPLSAAAPAGRLKPVELKGLVNNAKTPADHLKLARHFTMMAEKHESEAKEHQALAAEYRLHPQASETKRPMSPDTAAHCEYYAEHCRKAAKEMRALAAAHEQLAKHAGK